jgi:hypothetical protein
LTKRTTPRQQNKKSSAEAMYRIYREREKEGMSIQKHKKFQIEKNVLPEDGGGDESQLMAQPVQNTVHKM